MLLPLAGPSDRAARLCRCLNGECHEWKSTANRNPQEASPEGKAAETSSEAGERASARAFRAGSEAAEDEWLAEEVARFSACDIAPDGIVTLTKAQLIDPRDIEVGPIVGATCCAVVWTFCLNLTMPTIYLLPQCGDPEAEGECLQTVFPAGPEGPAPPIARRT